MILRTAFHVLLSRFERPVASSDIVCSHFRVWPTDLDVNGHMNNGKYLSIADIARVELMVRAGLISSFRTRGWQPVIAAETITFRRSLRLWSRFDVHTRIVGFDDRAVYVEQRFVVGGHLWARAFIRARFVKRTGGTVSAAELCDVLGVWPDDAAIPGTPEWMSAWAESSSLPPARAEAPNVWAQT